MIAADAAYTERQAIIAWLRSANQPMTHTAWALSKHIADGKHLETPVPLDTRGARIAQLEKALARIIICERLLHAGSASMDIAVEALGEPDDDTL